MNPIILLALSTIAAFTLAGNADAATVAQWDFNSTPPDASTSTGTTASSLGSGTASVVGSTSQSFVAGDAAHDPAPVADNSGWQTTGYPAATSPNRGGVRFAVDTSGYENISISWCQRNSATGSRYGRLQYTVDGVNFTDASAFMITADSLFIVQTVSLAAIPAVANAPAFSFRIVAEWQSAATGSGAAAYVATKTGSTYGTTGTWRFDMVTVSGTAIAGANTPPSISAVPDQIIRVNQSSGDIPFTIDDAQDSAGTLTLAKASSNPAVIPAASITFGGGGGDRNVNVAAENETGTADITVYVIDSGARSNSTSFTVTVLPANTAPVISSISRTNTVVNTATPPIGFTVSDLEMPAAELTLTGTSANPILVPDAGIGFGGTGSTRMLTVTPAPGQTGVAPIHVTVSDGTNTASSSFPVMVTPSPGVIFCEPFSYGDGSIITNSAALWTTRSGTAGQCQVADGQLRVCGTETEDVVGPLIGAPYVATNGIVLFSSFRVNFLTLPNSTPGLFAHFSDASVLRGRIYAGTFGASSPGAFRLYVANGSSMFTELAMDLRTNTTYTVVSRYDIDTASTVLWVNPASESSPSASAGDEQSPARITHYGFRQDAELGAATLLVDDLRVGLSFAEVIGSAAPTSIPLGMRRDSGKLILNWSDSLFRLQSATVATGLFTNVPGAISPYTNPIWAPQQFFRLHYPAP